MGPFDDNDPIITVQTPEGQTVRMPRSVAANFSGSLTPTSSGDPMPDPASPQSVTDPAAPPPAPEAPADRTVGLIDDGKFVPATAGPYLTKLSAPDEREFQQWVKARKVPFDPSDRADYDMRGFWQAARQGDPRAAAAVSSFDNQLHFPDTWKTPSHKTFSDESIYATSEAPSWQGDRLVDRNGRVVADETPKTGDGEALQEYVTPDGRTVRLPPSYAAKFDGLRPRGTTGDDLVRAGYGTVLDNQLQALRSGAAAGQEAAKNQQEYFAAKAAAIHASNEREIQIEQQKAKDANDRLARIDKLSADVSTNIEQLSKEKIDRSVAHPVLAALGVLLGAIGAAWANKSENPAMKALTDTIDRNVQAQLEDQKNRWQALNMKRGQIDQLRQQFTDHNAYYDALSAAERRKTIALGDEMMASSNSNAAKTDWAQHRAQLEMQAAGLQESAIDKEFGRRERDRNYQLASTNSASEIAARKAAAYTAAGHLALANKQFAFEKDYKTEEQAIERAKLILSQKGLDPNKVGEFGIGGIPTVQTDKDGAPITDASGKPQVGYKPVTNRDGMPFMAPTKEEAVALRKQKAGVDMVNDFVNQMTEGIARHGGESSFFKSGDWQEMMANKESLLFGLHQAYGVEGFRPGVLEQMEKALGGVDPTSFFRDATPGLVAAAKAVNSHYDLNMRAAGYTGDKYEPFQRSGKAPSVAPGDLAFQDVLRNPLDKDTSRTARELRVEPQKGETSSMYIARLKSAYAETGGLLPSQKQVLDTYAQVIADPKAKPEQKKIASESLSKAAVDAQTEGVRSYAEQLQTQLAAPQTPPEASVPVGYGAKDTSYGGPAQTLTAVMAQKPLADLIEGAQHGDVTSKQEINRRIAGGDKQAQKALALVIRSIK